MLPVYHRWDKVPPELATRTSLKRQRLALPEGAEPAAQFQSAWATYDLFFKADAAPVPYKRPPKDYTTLFEQRYPEKRSAYADACAGLHSLNRFAKHAECSEWQQREIYRLKDRWCELLWEQGFCIGALEVRTPTKDLPCWDCGGAGDDLERDYFCYKCEGTGVYRTVGGKPHWALRFRVDNQEFFWHVPKHLAPYASQVGHEEPHEVIVKEKPVRLARRTFAEVKALLLWILGPEPEPQKLSGTMIVGPAINLKDYWTSMAGMTTEELEEIPF